MEQRNLLLAIVVSLVIIFGFQFALETFFPEYRPQPTQSETTAATGDAPSAPAGGPIALPDAGAARKEALGASPRIVLDTPVVDGSIALRGGRLDDLKLKKYRVSLDDDSPEVTLLSPSGSQNPYFVDMGWVSNDSGLALPGSDTVWQSSGNSLTPGEVVTLTWDNGTGLVFTRTFTVDDEYLFEVTQTVENRGDRTVDLFPYTLASRTNTPETSGFWILHEGPLGVLDGTLTEIDYDDIQEERRIEIPSTGGWIGITDKYWLVALIPESAAVASGRFSHAVVNGRDKYQTDLVGGGHSLAPGQSASVTTHIFAGAKEVELLDAYAEQYGIDKFDRAIDFGWFYFLTKPLFYVLIWINGWAGNFGVAILLLTVLIKLVLFPLANKSYRSMSRMKKLQPAVLAIKERFPDDKQRQTKETMELYQREKVNPMSGCLPIIVQIPVFFALYKVLFVTIEMRHAPFFGWIDDLSAPDPTTIFNAFGLIPWTPPEILMIGGWPLIMGISMYLQQKLNPQPPDPMQARVFMMLPFIFTFLLARFPSGLVIYWAWNNTLSIAQQWAIMRGMDKIESAPPAPVEHAGHKDTEPEQQESDEDKAEDSEESGQPKTTTSAARKKKRGRKRRR